MRTFSVAGLLLFVLAAPGPASDYFWSNASGGAYTTAANWNGGIVPTGTDNATIDLGGTYTITLGAAAAVNNLTLNSAGLSFNHTAGSYTVNGTVTLSAGTYNLNGGTITGGVLTQGGGSGHLKFGTTTTSVLNNVQIDAGALDFTTTSGRATFTGGTNFTAPSSYSLGGSFILSVNQTQALDNLSLVLGNSSQLLASGTNGLTLGATSTVTFSGAGTTATIASSAVGNPITNNGTIQNTGTGTLNLTPSTLSNVGIIRQTTAGTLTVGSAASTITNQASGLIDVQAGTATFRGTFVNLGTLKLAAGTTINLAGNYTSSQLGRFDRGGTVPVAGSNGTILLNGGSTLGLTLDGNLDLHTSTGALQLQNTSIDGGGFTLSNSGDSRLIILNPGVATVFNILDNVVLAPDVLDLSTASGRVLLQGGTAFLPGSTYATGTGFTVQVNQTAPIDNLNLTLGASSNLGPTSTNGMTLGPNTTITFAATGTANVTTTTAAWPITNQGIIQNTGAGTLNVNPLSLLTNSGTIRNTSTGILNVGNGVVAWTNDATGLVDAQAGTTTLNGTLTNNGIIRVAPGATLNLGGVYSSDTLGRFDRGGTAPVVGSDGTVVMNGGSTRGLTLVGNFDLHTTLGPLVLNNGIINGGGFTLSTSDASSKVIPAASTGTIFNYLSNVVVGVDALDLSTTAGRLQLLGGTTFAPGSAYTTGTSFILQVDQTAPVDHLNLTLANSSALRASGTNGMTLGPNTVVTHSGVGTVTITATNVAWPVTNQGVIQNTSTGVLTVNPNSPLTNSGIIRNTSTGTLNLGVGTAAITNQSGGLFDFQAGTTNLRGTLANSGTIRVAAGATLNLSGTYTSSQLGRFDRGGTAPVAGSNGTITLLGTSNGLTLDGNLDLHTSTGPLLLNNSTIFGGGFTLATSDASSRLVATTAPGMGSPFNFLSNVVVGIDVLDLSTTSGKLQLQDGTTFVPGAIYTTGTSFDLRVNQAQPVNNLNLTLGTSSQLRASGADGMTLGPSTTITYAGTGTATVGATAVANNVTNQGVIRNTGTGTLNVNPSSTLTNAGTISNQGTGLTVVGGGTLINNGTLEAAGGTLRVPDSVTFTNYTSGVITGGTYRVSNGGILDFGTRQIVLLDSTSHVEFGPGGGSIPSLVGLNEVDSGASISFQSNFSFVGPITNNGSFVVQSSTVTVPGAVANGGQLIVQPAGHLQGTQNINVKPGGQLTVLGTGRVSVPAANQIIIEGSPGNPGILAGTGTLGGGLVRVLQNGSIRPGTSPGVITIENGLELGGTYDWGLNGNTDTGLGTNFDHILLPGGNLAILATAVFTADLTGVNFADPFWASAHAWPIIHLENGDITGTFTSPPVIQGADPTGYGEFGYAYFDLGASAEVQLTWTPTPVSESAFALGIAFAAMMVWATAFLRSPRMARQTRQQLINCVPTQVHV